MVHEAVRAELPILVSGQTNQDPEASSVLSEAHGDAAAIEGPQFLNEPVFEFLCHLRVRSSMMAQSPALNELGAVSPPAIDRIGERDLFRIAGVPAIFGEAHFFGSASAREGWQRRATFGCVHRMFFLIVSVAASGSLVNVRRTHPIVRWAYPRGFRLVSSRAHLYELRCSCFIERRFFLLGEGRRRYG